MNFYGTPTVGLFLGFGRRVEGLWTSPWCWTDLQSHCRGRAPRSVLRSEPFDACRGTRRGTPGFARASAPPRAPPSLPARNRVARGRLSAGGGSSRAPGTGVLSHSAPDALDCVCGRGPGVWCTLAQMRAFPTPCGPRFCRKRKGGCLRCKKKQKRNANRVTGQRRMHPMWGSNPRPSPPIIIIGHDGSLFKSRALCRLSSGAASY